MTVPFRFPMPMSEFYSLPSLMGGAKALPLAEQLGHYKTGFAGVVVLYKKGLCITGALNGDLIFPRPEPSMYRELVHPGMPMSWPAQDRDGSTCR